MAARDVIRPALVVRFETPKRVALNGLWFGPRRAKRAIIFIHGLSGSMFSARSILHAFAAPRTAVFAFNNRGFEHISAYKQRKGSGSRWRLGGAGHEVFTESADDIEGAVRLAGRMGAKEIYLAGHSTGCQKAYWWASRGGRGVKGIMLFGPLSDYSIALKRDAGKVSRYGLLARSMVKSGRGHELMPQGATWFTCDAQRYLSLHTPGSPEELFPYAHAKKPVAIRKVRIPTLVLLAGADEYGDKAPREIAEWFRVHLRAPHQVTIIPHVGHSFKGGEGMVRKAVRRFMRAGAGEASFRASLREVR